MIRKKTHVWAKEFSRQTDGTINWELQWGFTPLKDNILLFYEWAVVKCLAMTAPACIKTENNLESLLIFDNYLF